MSNETRRIQELEQQVESLMQQLVQAEKMTALGELASTTTHEFNNILMTIMNYAKMGLRHQDEPTRTKSLDKILNANQRAAKITNAILGTARNRGQGMEPTDLQVIVNDALVLLERELRKYRISVETQFENAPQVWANGNQIQQVLLNLVINARQAMGEGGRLLIRVGQVDDASVELFVRDSGKGIPVEQLPRIFDSFYTTKSGPDDSGKGGTGLGLASCKNIIEAHRGRIRVESAVGKGTAFSIRLPIAKQTMSVDLTPSLPLETQTGADI